MVKPIAGIDSELEDRLSALGFDLVIAEWAGSRRRPILRLRIDRRDAASQGGVTVEDCAMVSRALEPWLDEHEEVPERYVLEVSSPGVDRPLTRPGDFRRFRGERVAVKGQDVLAGRATRLEGELMGLEEAPEETVVLRLPGGDEVRIPRSQIREVRLVFHWK